MLQLERLEAFYGAAQILFGVDLQVAPGEVVALLGRNGAGKSTTLKAAIGLVPDRAGCVRFDGQDITRVPVHVVARRGLGYVPEERRIFSDLTIAENLSVGRRPARAGLTPWSPERLFGIFPNLASLRDRRAGETSGGEQQMLAVARTLMGNPRVVLLDEPSEGLAPKIVDLMAEAIDAMRREGIGVLLCEQNLPFARAVMDRAYLMDRGTIRWTGTRRALDDDPALLDAYLAA